VNIPILQPNHHWRCDGCGFEDVTHEARPHSRFHPCPAMGGLAVPMVRGGIKARVTAVEREDYVGDETVQTGAGGRPVMAVITEYEDGSNDTTVYAPLAEAKAE